MRVRFNAWLARTGAVLIAPGVLITIICCGLPLVYLASLLLAYPQALSEFYTDAFRLKLIIRTIGFNTISALLAVMISLPCAAVIGRSRSLAGALLWVCLPLTLLIPSLVYAYGWKQVFRIGGIDPIAQSPLDVARCIWILAAWSWPIAGMVIGLSWRRLDHSVQLAALLDGVLLRQALRQLRLPIAAAFIAVLILSMQEFAVYEPSGISVIATEVRVVFETGAISSADNPIQSLVGTGPVVGDVDQGFRAASAVAVGAPALILTLAMGGLVLWRASRGGLAEVMEWEPPPAALRPGLVTYLLAYVVVAVTSVLPVAALVLSLKRSLDPVRIFHEFSPQLAGSGMLALMAGAIALVLGLSASVVRQRTLTIVSIVSFLVGGQFLAIALIRIFNRDGLDWVYNSFWIAVIAYVARFGWVVLLASLVTFIGPWRAMRELAVVDGASRVQMCFRVIFPLAMPLLLGGSALVAALSFTEVPATVLIAPARPQSLVPTIMTWVHLLRHDPLIEACLLIVLTAVLTGIVAIILLRRGAAFPRGGGRGAIAAIVASLLISALPGCGRDTPDEIWLETGRGKGQVVYPRAIAYSAVEDVFFVVDRVGRMQKLDRNGKYILEWWLPQYQSGKPTGMKVGPDGNLYVADTHYHRVIVFDGKGNEIRRWGQDGEGPGEFIFPTDIAFDDQGRIFVSEYGDNDRIQVFDAEGKFLFQFGKFGDGDGEFVRPQTMLIDGDTLYVTDSCNHRISVFTTEGRFLRNMGSLGSDEGQFRFPYGMAFDRNRNLVISEFGNNRVQAIDRHTGKSLWIWGETGRQPGQLAYPWGIALDADGRVVVVDAGNNRLQVFRK